MTTTQPSIITARGNTLEIPMSDPVVRRHFENPNTYTEHLLKEINDGLFAFALKGKHGINMVDIGANVGLVSLYAHDVCGHILAVEPSQQFEVLTRLCKPYPNIKCVQCALAPMEGLFTFHNNDVNTTASSMENTYGTLSQVVGVTLRTLLERNGLIKVDVAKIDIEGSESKCLTDEQVGWARPIVREYYVECHNCPESTYQNKLATLGYVFKKHGYACEIDGDSIWAKQ